MNPTLSTPIVVGEHYLATGLVGFRLHTELRVVVTHICTGGQYANIMTADLADVGTKLVIDIDRLKPCFDSPY